MDWKRCCIREETKLMAVLRALDEAALQVVIVVDDNNRLRGIITDGDVRRALLQGMSMDAPAKDIMNGHPLYFQSTHSRKYVIRQMQQRDLKQAPVVNDKMEVIGLHVLSDLLKKRRRDNAVVLMAGGLGTRLRPLTNICPKPLLKVGNKPILETILENFIDNGFYRFYFSVNYKHEMIETYFANGDKWDVEISYLHERKRMGTAGALSLMPEKMEKSTIVMNGDLLTKVDFGELVDFHEGGKASGTMAVREYVSQIPYGVVEQDGERIAGIKEKPVHRAFVNAGIYVLAPDAIEMVKPERFLDMPELFMEMIQAQKKTIWYPIQEYWMDVGQMKDLQQARIDYVDVFEEGQ